MKARTKELAGQIRELLLALPDRVFIKTLTSWVHQAEEHLQYPDWSDEYRYALGYRIQSDDTQTIYATFNDLHENEPAAVSASWIEPGIEALRRILKELSIEQFYHTIISLAGDALFDRAAEEHWGAPPSTISDGYGFMEGLIRHLDAKIYRRPEEPRFPDKAMPSLEELLSEAVQPGKEMPLTRERLP